MHSAGRCDLEKNDVFNKLAGEKKNNECITICSGSHGGSRVSDHLHSPPDQNRCFPNPNLTPNSTRLPKCSLKTTSGYVMETFPETDVHDVSSFSNVCPHNMSNTSLHTHTHTHRHTLLHTRAGVSLFQYVHLFLPSSLSLYTNDHVSPQHE